MGHKRLGLVIVAYAVVLSTLGISTQALAAASATLFTGSVDAVGTSWRSHKVDVLEDSWMTATLDWDNPAANLNLFLKDPSGVIVAMATSTNKPEVIQYRTATPGRWTLGVKAKTGSANYTLTVTLDPVGGGGPSVPTYVRTRSAERRVGKECRSRWSPHP